MLSITKVGSSPEKVSHFAVELHPQNIVVPENHVEGGDDIVDATTTTADSTTVYGRVVA